MKFSILSLLAATTTIGLGVGLYTEHARNARLEGELKSRHEKELAEQKIGLALQYNVEHLLRDNYYFSQNSVRPDIDFASLAHIVNILDNKKFLDNQAELCRSYGDQPSLVMAAALLKQLSCVRVDNYFELFETKLKMLGMEGKYEHFRLGLPDSDKRKGLNEFLGPALELKNDIEIHHGEILLLRQRVG